jgi:acetyltransferase-like isoleucine patch superfamily enzyme
MTNLQQSFNTPWKVWNLLGCWMVYPSARLLFALNGIRWGRRWRLYGLPILQKHRQSVMQFGAGLNLRSSVTSNPLGPNHPVILCTWEPGAVLEVGEDFAMTGGSICAAQRIKIGSNVAVGANSTIADTDFHPLNAEYRRRHPQESETAPICIEDDVFIGMNCQILKGVTIGRGSVIGAGSVVAKDVPAGVIAAGNPARVIREV